MKVSSGRHNTVPFETFSSASLGSIDKADALVIARHFDSALKQSDSASNDTNEAGQSHNVL